MAIKKKKSQFYDVFISYAREDLSLAADVYYQLKGQRLRPVMDKENLIGGENQEGRLQQLQRHSTKVLFLMSKHSCVSGACARELRLANEWGMSIIPVRIDETPVELFPNEIRGLQYIRLSESGEKNTAMSQIGQAVKVNLTWESEKPFYLERAERGELLSSKSSIKDLITWINSRPQGSPPPPTSIRTLLFKSRRWVRLKACGLMVAVSIVVTTTSLSKPLEIEECPANYLVYQYDGMQSKIFVRSVSEVGKFNSRGGLYDLWVVEVTVPDYDVEQAYLIYDMNDFHAEFLVYHAGEPGLERFLGHPGFKRLSTLDLLRMRYWETLRFHHDKKMFEKSDYTPILDGTISAGVQSCGADVISKAWIKVVTLIVKLEEVILQQSEKSLEGLVEPDMSRMPK